MGVNKTALIVWVYGMFPPMGTRTDPRSLLCNGIQEETPCSHTPLSLKLCAGGWIEVSPCQGGIIILGGTDRAEGSDSVTYTASKPYNYAEVDNGTKGR